MTSLFKLTTVVLTTLLTFTSCASIEPQKGRIIEFTSDANGFHTKTIFYEGQEEVVAFDAQFTEKHARQAIEHLRKFTKKPISWLIITHPNPDKFNGAKVFQAEGAKVIASDLTKKNMPPVHAYKKYYFIKIAGMFTEDNYPQLPSVDEVFSDELELTLKGNDKIIIKELERPAVSTNQTIIEIPQINTLIVGDLVHHNTHAWLEGGIIDGHANPTIKEWIQTLNTIKENYSQDMILYGGRGEVATIEFAIHKQIEYLEKAELITKEYVRNLGERFHELKSDQATKHYGELTKIFENEFPNYNLSYMIQYGVYGLVQAKL